MSTGFFIYGHNTNNSTPNNSVIALGNSLLQYSGGVSISGGTFRNQLVSAGGVLSGILRGLNYKLLAPYQFNYSQGGSTSLRAYYALNSVDTNNYSTAGVATSSTNPAYNATHFSADLNYIPFSTGQYTVINDPSNTVVILAADNDPSYPVNYNSDPIWGTNVNASMNAIELIVDALLQAGKQIIIYTGHPRGVQYLQFETLNLTNSVGNCIYKSTYLNEASAYGGPGCYDALTGNYLSLTTGTVSSGQYNVSNGVYTTFPADNITKLCISYTSAAGARSTAGGQWMLTYVNWLKNNSATFVDTVFNVTFTRSGFLYNRPTVKVIDTWTPFADPATSGATTKNLPGSLIDGLHPTTYGVNLYAQATKQADTSVNLTNTTQSYSRLATSDAIRSNIIANGTTNNFALTLSNSMLQRISPVYILSGSNMYVDLTRSGNFVNVKDQTNLTTVADYIQGTINVTFAVAPAANSLIMTTLDPNNLLCNPLFDYTRGNGTNSIGSVTAGSTINIPKEWILTGAIPTGVVVNIGSGTDSLGNNCIDIRLSGFNTSASGQSLILSQVLYQLTSKLKNTSLRGGAHIEMSVGSDGNLSGVGTVGTLISVRNLSSNPAIIPGNNSTGVTYFYGQDQVNYQANNIPSNFDLKINSSLIYDSVSADIPISALFPDETPFQTIAFVIPIRFYAPISARIKISLAHAECL